MKKRMWRSESLSIAATCLAACGLMILAACDDDSTGFDCIEIDASTVTRIAPNGDTIGNVDARDWLCTPLETLCPMPAKPNPADGGTVISFSLEDSSAVTIELRDRCGELVKNVLDRKGIPAGEHEVPIDTRDERAGMYRVHIIAWTSGGVVSDETTGELIISH